MSCKWKTSKLNKSEKQKVNYRYTFLLYSSPRSAVWFLYKCYVIYVVVFSQLLVF